MTETRRPLWREPLVHFLLAGAAIFALNAWRGPSVQSRPDRILVSVEQVERMAALWQATWGRVPSDEEIQAMIRDYIQEEVYYREALKLGLDVNDTAIRRRLRQKMEFLTLADLEGAEPGDEVLQAWFEAHPDRYQPSPELTFEQVYFKTGNDAAASAALARLISDPEAAMSGDPISLAARFEAIKRDDVARAFGNAFANQLPTLPIGTWTGPVRSGFGQHIVRVIAIETKPLPAFDEVREAVKRDWLADARTKAEADAYQKLQAQYRIEIESPEP